MRIASPPIILVMAVAAVIGFTAPAEADAKPRALKVMTFNIHHGQGTDGNVDLRRIAEVIDGGDPAVVGLQEVDRHWSERSDFVDQASWLARRLRMHVVYGANLDLDPLTPGEPRRQYGTAILSRSRIIDSDNRFLPKYEGHEQRGLLRARVKVRGVPLQVYNTHLQHDNAAERLEQAQAIKTLIGRPRESFVLLGDLNATPEQPEIRALADDMADSWVEGGVGDGLTYDSEDPTSRIDYVLTSSRVVTRTAAVVTSDPVASDHLPVIAEVLLPGSRHGDR
ncbi:endonuclease/exonuclease/phosphatase family protein [Actinomadura sp. HBU206391]|uniref:endonuclease/exonuclease/phosphatase family protein n=1 Tax=Actinomadura sp. HBU206391 TaxID=2731692 RepID=UPI00164F8510|nr:endonuclease/exonuclease/phosphatase family protein [Actinomadura sp. HBU206391]MBC6460231.1 endonuclease/exonuclease/phosphatase family protein [Actinomadura sp. HBU206391]